MERKKLSTCSWLVDGVGGVVIGVVVLEVDEEEEEEDMNLLFLLVLSLSSFIVLENLFGVGDVCFWFPSAFCFRVSFPVN